MFGSRIWVMLGTLAVLGACGTIPTTRNLPFEVLPSGTGDVVAQSTLKQASLRNVTNVSAVSTSAQYTRKSTRSMNWTVKDVRINVPDSLRVSEANSFMPAADIVWHGDPYGDRRAQVREIMDLAVSQAALSLDGPEPVYIDIDLRKFHALSRKARATIGGWHTIKFTVHVRDVASGEDVIRPFPVDIELKAYGGQRAINAEMQGLTQKLRIEREVTRVMREHLKA